MDTFIHNREHLLLVSTEPVAAGYKTVTQLSNYANQLVIQFSSLPGVKPVDSFASVVSFAVQDFAVAFTECRLLTS